jgi:hypothetical protein
VITKRIFDSIVRHRRLGLKAFNEHLAKAVNDECETVFNANALKSRHRRYLEVMKVEYEGGTHMCFSIGGSDGSKIPSEYTLPAYTPL